MEKELTKVENGVVLVKTSWQSMVKLFDPINPPSELAKISTLEQAVKFDSPTLGAIQRTFGDEKVHSLLCLYIAAVVETLNLSRSMNGSQIEICANRIINKHKRLKLADIHVIVQKAMNGEYELYEGVSGAKIMKWFDEYFERRCEYFVQMNQSDHEYTKNHGGNGELMQALKEKLNESNLKVGKPVPKKKKQIPMTLEELKKEIDYNYKNEK